MTLKRWLFLLLLAALAIPCRAAKDSASFPLYDRALQAYLNGDFKSALDQVNAAIRTDSDFYPAYALRARLAVLAQYSSQADKDTQRIISGLGSSWSLSEENLIARGDALVLKNRPDEALANFNSVIKANPDSAQALSGRARVWRAQGKSDEALADLNFLLAKETRFPVYFYERAYCYYDANHYGSAVADLVKALRLNPQFYPAYGLLGAALAKERDTLRSGQAYTRALALNPQYVFAYMGRAQLYLALGEKKKALDDFAAAIRLNSRDYAPYYNRAEAFWSLGRRPEALEDYHKALASGNFPDADALEVGDKMSAMADWKNAIAAYTQAYKSVPGDSPISLKALVGRSRAYDEGLHDSKKAMQDLDEAVLHAGSAAEPWGARASLELKLGLLKKVKPDLDQALKLDPKNAEILTIQGNFYARIGNYDDAMKDFNTAIINDPKFAAAYNDRGVLYFKIFNNSAQALKDVQAAIALNDQRPDFHFNLGMLRLNSGDFAPALDSLNQALALKGATNIILRYRADTYSRLGDESNAVQDIETALDEEPRNASLYAELGLIHLRAADYQQALRDSTEALDQDPRNVPALLHRGEAYGALGSLKRALTDIRSAAQIDPHSKEALAYLCQADRLNGDPEAAVENCNHALAIDENYAQAYVQKGISELELKQPAKAIADLGQASELGLRRPEALLAQAVAHATLRQYQDAHNDFKQAMNLNSEVHDPEMGFGPPTADPESFYNALDELDGVKHPDTSDPYVYILLGDALLNAEHFDKAISAYTNALQLDGGLSEAYVGRALCLEAEHDYDTAQKDLLMALKHSPNDASVHVRMAELLTVTRSFPQALKEAAEAVRIDPHNSAAFIQAGHARYFMRDYQKALDNYQLAAQVDPLNPKAFDGIGLGLFALHRYPEAIDNFSRAIFLYPQDARFYRNRGSAYADMRNFNDAVANFMASKTLNIDPLMVKEYLLLIQKSQAQATTGKS